MLLAKTGASGMHFEDDKEMQGYELAEWSRDAREAEVHRGALQAIIARAF